MRRVAVSIFCLLILTAPSFGAVVSQDVIKGPSYIALPIANVAIPTASYIEKTFTGIGGFSELSFLISDQSTGNAITTANIDWKIQNRGVYVTVRSQEIKQGQCITEFPADNFTIKIYSNINKIVRVTGNVMVSQKNINKNKLIKKALSFDIPNSSTIVTATSSNYGNWTLTTDSKIYIDFDGDTATSDDLPISAGGSINFYMKQGQVISIISDSGTAHVRGLSDD